MGFVFANGVYRWVLPICSVAIIIGLVSAGYKGLMPVEDLKRFTHNGRPLWIQPIEPGGMKTQHLGYAVNSIIAGNSSQKVSRNITRAPQVEGIPENVLSPRQIRALRRQENLEFISLQNDISTTESSTTMVDSDGELHANAENIQGQANIETTIPVSKSNQPRLTILYTGIEISVTQITSQAIVAQLGTYSEREQAQNKWNDLRASFPDHLGSRDWVIEPYNLGNQLGYRLRVLGFWTYGEARDFCQIMTNIGVSCIATSIF